MKKILTLVLLTGSMYVSKAQTITGGDMETWKTYKSLGTTLNRPNGWSTSDSLIRVLKFLSNPLASYTGRVTQSTSVKHGGTSSASLVSSTDSLPTIIVNGIINADLSTGDFTITGGTNVTKRIINVNAWTQYASAGSKDTGMMIVNAYKNGIGAGGTDSLIGSGELYITPTSSFTKLVGIIDYNDATTVPDRIIVAFFTSALDVPLSGTTLFVDDVTLVDPTTGISTPLVNDQNIKVYPNPAVNQLHVSTEINDAMTLTLYNAAGQAVLIQHMNKEADVNVSGLASGNYVYVISAQNGGHKYYSASFTKQ